MKEFLNKHVWIHIKIEDNDRYYDAIISSITDTHITFIDKFGEPYSYKLENVEEVKLFVKKEVKDD